MIEYVISVNDFKLTIDDIYTIQGKIQDSCRYSNRNFELFTPEFEYSEKGSYIMSFTIKVIDAQWLAREAYKAIVEFGIPQESINCEVAEWQKINFDVLPY